MFVRRVLAILTLGLALGSVARSQDLASFDLVLAMDRENHDALQR